MIRDRRTAGAGRRGFTLAEVAIGVVLIGVVASAVAPHLAGAKVERRDALRDLRAFARAQGAFHAAHGRYASQADLRPTAAPGGLAFRWHRGVSPVAIRATRSGWSAEVRLASGKRCALVVGGARAPESVPGLVAGIPACEP